MEKHCLECQGSFNTEWSFQKYCNRRCLERKKARLQYSRRKARNRCVKCKSTTKGATYCKECRKKYIPQGVKYRAARRVVRQSQKQQLFALRGGRCECCDEGNLAFLTIDHINGLEGGKRESTIQILNMIEKFGWPKNLRLLCYNCNMGRARQGGICPHVRTQE